MLSRWTAVIQAIELRWSFLGLNPKTNRIPETVMGKTPPQIFLTRGWLLVTKSLSTLRWWNLKTTFSLWKRIRCIPSTIRRWNLKTQQSPTILDFCLRKTQTGKTRDYRDAIVFKRFHFPNVFRRRYNFKPAFSNSPPFSWRISVDGRPNHRNKVAF